MKGKWCALPPPKTGRTRARSTKFIQKLKPGPDFPLSVLHGAHTDLAKWRPQARAKVFELMHYAPEKCEPRTEIVSRVDRGDYFQEEIRFNTTPVFRVPATVLIPKKAKLPRRASSRCARTADFIFGAARPCWSMTRRIRPSSSSRRHMAKAGSRRSSRGAASW